MTVFEETFFMIGVAGGILFCLGILMLIGMFIKDKIEDVKRSYRIKHRFDKPPTADCYCIDCINYSVETHKCYSSRKRYNQDNQGTGFYRADNYFCGYAERKKN